MKQTFTRIIILLMINLSLGFSQENKSIRPADENYKNGNGFETNQNRLPQLLRDVKVLLSDALIADVMADSLEVVYNLNSIFDLLTEADQYGDMNDEDREEFERFEDGLINLYTHSFKTIDKIDGIITAEHLGMDITSITEPLEVEMGATKFTVVDDRDGHIPLVRNKKVDQVIKYFQTKGRRQFEIWLERLDVYGPMINQIIHECNLPPELVYIAMIESGLNPKAYSKAAANGMWQFIYSTGKLYGLERNWYVDERRDPEKATRAACAYLTDLYEEFDNWYLALAAYNAGEGRVRRGTRIHQTSDFWQLHSLPRETRNYIPYFLAATIIAENQEEYGFYKKKKKKPAFGYDIVQIEKSADLMVLARSAETTYKKLRNLNSELRQSATPTKGYALKIPKGKKDIFMANYNALPENERFAPQFVSHKVRNGESLWTIAKKYHISVHDLAAVNKVRNRSMIRIGQKLTIPIAGVNMASIPISSMPGFNKLTYKVRKGDTLGHIAEDHGTRASNIRKWNGIKYGQHIYPGQKLTLWVKQG